MIIADMITGFIIKSKFKFIIKQHRLFDLAVIILCTVYKPVTLNNNKRDKIIAT